MKSLQFLVLFVGVIAPARAQQVISVAGNVSVRAADDAPWSAAAAGLTLTPGMSVSTGSKAMADIRVNPSDSFQAAANSQCKFAGLDNGKYRIELNGGTITYQAADPGAGSLSVNLPGVAVEPAQPGIYVVTHTPGGQSQITVRAGLARVTASSGSELVNQGQKMLIRYSATGPEFRIVSAFSKWRRFLSVAGAAIQIAGNISGGGGGASEESSHKAVLPAAKGSGNASKPVDTRLRSDPPAKSGPPPAAPVSRGK